MEPIQGNVSIDAQNIMPIIKKWLYSDKDIFIREVVSNGCDAITKLRMVDSAAAQNCSIHVEVDKAARELRFIDDGVGMTEDEVKTNINQVAFSGAKSFMEEYAKNEDQENSGIIGHFGLGFYSVFMIADKVTIDTLSFREGATPGSLGERRRHGLHHDRRHARHARARPSPCTSARRKASSLKSGACAKSSTATARSCPCRFIWMKSRKKRPR